MKTYLLWELSDGTLQQQLVPFKHKPKITRKIGEMQYMIKHRNRWKRVRHGFRDDWRKSHIIIDGEQVEVVFVISDVDGNYLN